ncbi:MAG: hypothetical protein AAB221_13785 [Bacteroidota bacterium]
MKKVALNIDSATRPQKLADILREHNLHQGDELTIITFLAKEMTFLIVLISLAMLHRKKMDYANKALKDIFDNKDSKEIQDEIAREYGIDVQVEIKNSGEEDSWRQFSKENLSKAYGIDEPEYELSMVKEPNPEYKK